MNIEFANIETLLHKLNIAQSLKIENLKWIEPIGIALLKLYKSIHPNIKISIQGKSNSVNYVKTLLDPNAPKNRSYIPLEHFSSQNSNIDEIANNITKKILNNDHTLRDDFRADFAKHLKYLIAEMIDNVISHSMSGVGGIVTAQYYPTKKKVQVVIIDGGVGLKETLSRKYNIKDEQEAIIKAMEKEVSGSNTFAPYTNVPKHAGLGLFFLSKIIEHTSGKLLIVSNNTIYRSNQKSFNILKTDFHGTIVAFEIFEERLDYEFQQLFNIIKDEGEENDEGEDIF